MRRAQRNACGSLTTYRAGLRKFPDATARRIKLPAQLSGLRENFFNTATPRLALRNNPGGGPCQNLLRS